MTKLCQNKKLNSTGPEFPREKRALFPKAWGHLYPKGQETWNPLLQHSREQVAERSYGSHLGQVSPPVSCFSHLEKQVSWDCPSRAGWCPRGPRTAIPVMSIMSLPPHGSCAQASPSHPHWTADFLVTLATIEPWRNTRRDEVRKTTKQQLRAGRREQISAHTNEAPWFSF